MQINFQSISEEHFVTPQNEPDLDLVSEFAFAFFQAEGPNSVGLTRPEYMNRIWKANPRCFTLLRFPVKVSRSGKFLSSHYFGYVSVIPLKENAARRYAYADREEDQLSQFEFDNLSICDDTEVDSGAVKYIYIQALAVTQWTHREFFQDKVYLGIHAIFRSLNCFSPKERVVVLAEGTSAHGKDWLQKLGFRIVSNSVEGHPIFASALEPASVLGDQFNRFKALE